MSKFSVIEVPPTDPNQLTELEGALDKYWLDLPDLGRSLIKIDPRGAWVEKITATLAERIGLPVAGCELGQTQDGERTIVSPSFLQAGASERSGEDLLEKRFGRNYLYIPEPILAAIDAEAIALPRGWEAPEPISQASDLMVGYLIFDSYIGNIDRHAKNWGIQQSLDGRKELLPTYDHGLSLGVSMPEDKLPIDLADFSSDLRSSIQGEIGGALTMNVLTSSLLELRPEAARFWIDRIRNIDRALIEETFDRLPEEWASDVRMGFAIDLLEASRDRLVMLASDSPGERLRQRSSAAEGIRASSEEINHPTSGRQSS